MKITKRITDQFIEKVNELKAHPQLLTKEQHWEIFKTMDGLGKGFDTRADKYVNIVSQFVPGEKPPEIWEFLFWKNEASILEGKE